MVLAEATKPAVLTEFAARQKAGVNPEPFLLRKSGLPFFNTSPLDMKKTDGIRTSARTSSPICKLAGAELHFDQADGLISGMTLMGFAVWERPHGQWPQRHVSDPPVFGQR